MTMPKLHRSTALRWTCLVPVLGLTWGDDAIPPATVKPGAAGDELALFSDLPVVVSASRQQTTITRSPVPVSVLDDEALAAGGHYRIEEVLRFVPAVDVRRISRNTYAIGVRGFHGSFSDRTLTLVDGRNADSPVFGGSEFYRLPVVLDDLDHIEVVRGPGGAAWGANAFNGVINLITKDPEDMLGLRATTTVSGFGDLFSSARWCETAGDWSWKLGVSYEKHRSSSEVLDDDSYADNDWGEKIGTDNAVVWRATDTTTVRGGVGYSDIEAGAFELLGYEPDENDHLRTLRTYARVDQGLAESTSLRFGWYGNFFTSERPAVFDERSDENVIEVQLDWTLLDNHRLSLGGEWRNTNIEQYSGGAAPEVDLANSPYHEQRYGAFLIDHWQVASRTSIEGQIRADYYDGTGSDWAGRIALVHGIDQDQNHTARVAGARAYRTPLPALRDSTTSRPGVPPFFLLPSEGLENEHVWSAEAGYSGQFTSDLLARVDVFYLRYEDLIGFELLSQVPYETRAANLDGADAYGGEIELVWSPSIPWDPQRLRVSTWYTYEKLETDQENQEIRAFTPAEHKVGVTTRVPLPAQFAFNLNYAYNSSSVDPDVPESTHVSIHHQCDLSLAWALPGGHGELMIGVWDVFHRADDEVAATGTSAPHETPGRTFYLRGVLDF